MSHRKMFVSALFKTVFHLIFNAKIMSMLEITFGISFICNDLDLTDILSKQKTLSLLSNATVGALIQNVGPSESMIRLSFNMAAASHTWLRNEEF